MLATLAVALCVAAWVKRPAPDFSRLPVIAVLRDGAKRAAWAIRLAPRAHEIAVDSLRPDPAPPGHSYQLWFVSDGGTGPQQLGLLPAAGRKELAVTPAAARRLAGGGRLSVTLEPAGGSPAAGPSGPELFRGRFGGSG